MQNAISESAETEMMELAVAWLQDAMHKSSSSTHKFFSRQQSTVMPGKPPAHDGG